MKDGTLKHTFKGNVREREMDYIKQSFFRYFSYSQVNLHDTRDKIMSYLKSDFKDLSENGKLYKDFKELASSLDLKKYVKYSDLDSYQRKAIDDFSMKIIKSDDELKDYYLKTFSQLAKAEKEIKAYENVRNKTPPLKSKSETFRADLFKRMGGVILQSVEEVKENSKLCSEKIEIIYSSGKSNKAKSTSVRMVKKGLSKLTYRAFRWIMSENSGANIKKNYNWLKIIREKDEEERKRGEKIR